MPPDILVDLQGNTRRAFQDAGGGYAEILKQWEMTQINTSGERLSEPIASVYLASSTGQA